MIIGPAGFMHTKDDNNSQPPYRLSELGVGMQLLVRVGMGDERVVTVTKINNKANSMQGFYWKDLHGGKGWAYVDQILRS